MISLRLAFVFQSVSVSVAAWGSQRSKDEPHCSHRNAARVLTYTAHPMGAIAIEELGEAAA